ncbi:MAG: agmatinase, partial [Cyanobacteria bacterium P01_H01_bin.119]
MTDLSTDDAFDRPNSTEASRALEQEQQLPMTGWQQEVQQGLTFGLEAAASIRDRSISTFSRGELPHFAGINTFLKAPYLEDVRRV